MYVIKTHRLKLMSNISLQSILRKSQKELEHYEEELKELQKKAVG